MHSFIFMLPFFNVFWWASATVSYHDFLSLLLYLGSFTLFNSGEVLLNLIHINSTPISSSLSLSLSFLYHTTLFKHFTVLFIFCDHQLSLPSSKMLFYTFSLLLRKLSFLTLDHIPSTTVLQAFGHLKISPTFL